MTGSVNQACIEAGTSEKSKEMLCKAEMVDVTMAPAADMFEMGVMVQVLRRGTLFAQRGAQVNVQIPATVTNFAPGLFGLPTATSPLGNAGRNITYGPGLATVDLVLQKQAALSSRVRLELRWEIFNLLNRVNFDLPNRIAFTPNFGRIFSAGDARQMQFGGRLLF